ncbi:hypothetical protein SAMN05216184_10486 [Georgenia satyanarayanai]|uniref:Uncharacterized protein n=1 Tax=Georgenia satyanarayanai TaxID=860221 RepID=A0A2Y9ACP9_9MICO|nr:hypothetical protein [Georgenia satyanarayanai]PYG00147.1 hypothetical protein A8987_10486 [Georgenia satyanarayanai]SSA40349.1 hypothetical protein SAMN05216184_10486 [Georgenia satyanarayanai]
MTTTPFEPVELPSRYSKAIVATLVAVVTVLSAALTDTVVDSVELANVGLAFLTAVAVYWVPNAPEGWRQYAKAVVAVLGTALQALVPFLVEGHVAPAQWLLVLLAGIGALAVGVVPNTQPVPATRNTDGSFSVTNLRVDHGGHGIYYGGSSTSASIVRPDDDDGYPPHTD